MCRKKKKKVKNLKKKKKKSTSKARRHSKRSSSSSHSSSESSSESDPSIQSSDSEEWVESTATGRNETKQQGSHSKRDHKSRSDRESPVHTAGSQKETKSQRSRKRTDSSPENDEKKNDNWKGNDVRRKMKRFSSSHSSSSRSPSVERERVQERVRRKESRERVGHDTHQSPGKRKTSECESYKRVGEDVSKPVQYSPKGSVAVSSFHEKSVESMLKTIRENSGKDAMLRQTSAEYCSGNTSHASRGSKIDSASNNRISEKLRSRETEWQGTMEFKESYIYKGQNSAATFVSNSKAGHNEAGRVRDTSKSLGLRDQRSRSTTDRKPSLVSYGTSSDEDKS